MYWGWGRQAGCALLYPGGLLAPLDLGIMSDDEMVYGTWSAMTLLGAIWDQNGRCVVKSLEECVSAYFMITGYCIYLSRVDQSWKTDKPACILESVDSSLLNSWFNGLRDACRLQLLRRSLCSFEGVAKQS